MIAFSSAVPIIRSVIGYQLYQPKMLDRLSAMLLNVYHQPKYNDNDDKIAYK